MRVGKVVIGRQVGQLEIELKHYEKGKVEKTDLSLQEK